ncbi:MAG: integrase [Thiotrichaceae bacterium]|nr:MAG: integrase [Thiotrichaceae bacterium]
MASNINDKQVKALLRKKVPGRYAAGGGLYFRVSNEGTGFWLVRYTTNGKRREITLDKYPQLALVDARAKCAILKAEIKSGIDPQAEKKRPAIVKIYTVDDLAEDWLLDCEKRLKHPNIPRRVYEKNLAPVFGELSLERVTPLDIRAAIEKIVKSNRPTIANDALMYCKQLFRHAIRLNLMTTNPAEAFTVHQAGGVEKSRDRYLTVDELAKVFTTFRQYSDQFTRENYLAVALLLVLGVRKGELIAAEWCEFDIDDAVVWNIPEERSKTGVAISVPLPPVAIEWLQELHIRACGSEYVFPKRRSSVRNGHISPDTLNAAIQKLFKGGNMPVEHFTVHDLRRTCRSLMAEAGIAGHVAERCLNHKLKGVEGIYDRYDYLDERRAALQKIADQLTPIINPLSNVTSFRKRA